MPLTNKQLELNKRFVAALRSGEYKQCKGQLSRTDDDNPGSYTYCCLGVSAIVAEPEYFKGSCRRGQAEPNRAISKLYGWSDSHPRLGTDYATALNDYKGFNFNQIADEFEATFITPQTQETPSEQVQN